MGDRIRVLVADDSKFVCRLLTAVFENAPDFEVVGAAHGGREAVEKVKALRPDALTLDLDMPGMDGLEALNQIMRECPTPVVAISGVSGKSAIRTMEALERGAVDFVLKYTPGSSTDPELLNREILAKVRAASKIRVIRQLATRVGTRPLREGGAQTPVREERLPAPEPVSPEKTGEQRTVSRVASEMRSLPQGIVVIGASTGGPLALRELLTELPANYAGAMLIVQHMPGTFTGVLAAQLDRHAAIEVREAVDGDVLVPGLALVAPGGTQLVLREGLRISLEPPAAEDVHCPSVDVAMEAAVNVYGSRVRGVLLTGMGEDGARGMMSIRARGGRTYAQDAASCVVNGMPGKAVERGAVDHVATPKAIGRMLAEKG